MNKRAALEEIAQTITHCVVCKEETVGKAVPGEGNPDTRVVFVGEAPGKQESVVGRPFIGRSGKLLRDMLHSIGLGEEDLFITSVGKYLPVRGTPTKSQIIHGRVHLLRQLAIIQPRIVVLLGSVAVQGVLGERVSIRAVHGTLQESKGVRYFLTYHPAAALRSPGVKEEFIIDFHRLRRVVMEESQVRPLS